MTHLSHLVFLPMLTRHFDLALAQLAQALALLVEYTTSILPNVIHLNQNCVPKARNLKMSGTGAGSSSLGKMIKRPSELVLLLLHLRFRLTIHLAVDVSLDIVPPVDRTYAAAYSRHCILFKQ